MPGGFGAMQFQKEITPGVYRYTVICEDRLGNKERDVAEVYVH